MKHDFRIESIGPAADRFCDWLLSETTDSLARDYGDAEATKTSIFLFVNRAIEARLPDARVAEIFGKSLVRAGYQEQDEASALAWLESFTEISRGVHGGT